ncbi:ferritin-like domain-containing protein [Nonomuraea typhae]|uniref:ferritin-like domain-containing protein n=1 Tax=Nonomuraea typhae TaxID=2603600 RepID=UPI0012FB37FC|nr:ferritin-like domain-containing protein [Nonomuraea typhae]
MNDVERLRKALSAEHAAVYAYGLIGARTTGSLRTRATAAFDAHRARRDQLRGLITARQGTPAEPEASYALPVTPGNPTEAVRLAVHVEQAIIVTYLELAACDDGALRRYAALAMQEAATRCYGFRPSVTAFPGMPAAVKPSPSPSG